MAETEVTRLLASLHVPSPVFDWSSPDRHEELRLFRTQVDNWFELKNVPEAKRKACVLSLLGKEGIGPTALRTVDTRQCRGPKRLRQVS